MGPESGSREAALLKLRLAGDRHTFNRAAVSAKVQATRCGSIPSDKSSTRLNPTCQLSSRPPMIRPHPRGRGAHNGEKTHGMPSSRTHPAPITIDRNVAEAKPARIVINTQTYSVLVDGTPVALTALQFDLFKFLLNNRQRVVGHSEIAREVFRRIGGDTGLLVRVHVCHLRQAMGPGKQLIVTIRGRGYRLTVGLDPIS
jgi:hypothetical protein